MYVHNADDDGDDLKPRELVLKVSLHIRYIFLLSKSSLGYVSNTEDIVFSVPSHALQCLSNLKSACSPHTSKNLGVKSISVFLWPF